MSGRQGGWVATGGALVGAFPEVVVGLVGLVAFMTGWWPFGMVAVALLAMQIESFTLLISQAVLVVAGLTALYALVVHGAWVRCWPVALVTAVWFGGLTWRWWRGAAERDHYDTYLTPLHWALGFAFGLTAKDLQGFGPEDWLLGVQPALLDAEGGIVIRLPTARVPKLEQRQEVERVLVEKLGLRSGDYEVEWRLDASNRHLHVFRAPPKETVPEAVLFDDEFRQLLVKGRGHQWLVGRGLGGRPYYLNPDQDNPHVLLSCLTGWGKSNAVSVILADHLHWGREALVLDAKYGSLPWAADLPGVTYARRVREIHDALIRIGVESERRRRQLEDAPWNERPKFSRLLIVVEETNTTIDELAAFWVEERARLKQEAKDNDERIDLPAKSPALRVYRQLGYMGRELRMNLIVISQRAEAAAVGGSAIRDQLGTKILGWPSPPDWNMHAKAIPFRQSNGKPGHSFIIRVGKCVEVQWAYADVAEFRDWATSGVRPVATIGLPPSHENGNRSHLGGEGGSFLGRADRPSAPEDPDDSPITLRQAVDEGVIEAPLSSVQRWSRPSMDNGFPSPVGGTSRSAKLYDRIELRSWWSLYRPDVVEDDQRTK